jgi:nitrile hydratase
MAHGGSETPQNVYSVRFTARELWGDDASARDSLYVDMWDDYLDSA